MKLITLLASLALFATTAVAQDAASAALRPPKGAEVAIVVFEDLQCPDCRRAAPLLVEASKKYEIPVVVHDYPLPQHQWSYQAAVIARFFDGKSLQLGHDYRNYIYEHQLEVTADNLRQFSDKFARDHNVDLPFVVDPQGKLAAEVDADKDLGNRIGIEHTPTIYVVSSKRQGKPFVEVVDRTQLYQLIDSMKRGE